jgi:transposase
LNWQSVFQAHGADASGGVVFRKRLRRNQMLAFFASQPRCLVAMEACAGAHYWAREIAALGHEIRLIPPAYVKPFVKRQKNDMADAEAICEAAQRPTMRFVKPKTAAAQAAATVFRTRDLLVRQRTQMINALRGHLAEFGMVAPKGIENAPTLIELVRDPASDLRQEARSVLAVPTEMLELVETKIAILDREITRRAKTNPLAKSLMSIPGIGPITATALAALAPAPETLATEIERRQGAVGEGLEDGRSNAAPPADQRSQLCRQGGRAKGRHARDLARTHAVAQAAHAGDGRPGQQDCSDRLGADGAWRNL